jgi:hypothetical protein
LLSAIAGMADFISEETANSPVGTSSPSKQLWAVSKVHDT